MTSRSAGGPGRARRALAAALAISLLAGLPLGAAAREPDRGARSALPPAPATSPTLTQTPVLEPPGGAAATPGREPADTPAPVSVGVRAPDLRAYRVRPGDEPSQMYVDTVANEARSFAFAPGGRASVGFRPRVDDTWPVDGHAPRALPAGRLSGAAMAGPADTTAGGAPSAEPSGASPSDPARAAEPPTTPTPTPTTPSAIPGPSPSGEPSPIPAVGASLVVPGDEAPLAPAAVGMRRDVYGFLPYWEVADADTRLDFSVITHLAYFSVGADARGNLKKRNSNGTLTTGWAGWTSSRMTSIINAAHAKHSRVTLTLSVFAWTSGQVAVQKALLGSSAARLNLARQAVAAVRDRGADGINLDFEPLVSGYEDEFVALVRTIRAELKKVAPGYHLSFDTLGYPGNYPLEGALASGGADAVLIMGYDYRTASSNYAGSIDPLAGPAYDLTDTVRTYTARVPASRVILGIPYYGRAWSTVSSAVNSHTQTGAKYGYSSAVNYSIAVDYAAQHGRRYDGREVSAWVAYRRQNCTSTYGCVTSWRQIYYDDATTLKARYDLVNRAGLRGAGIWALGYDGTRRELYQALADKFLHDTTPPMAGIAVLPGAERDEGFRVSWSALDDWNGVRSYDVQVSVDGGAWTTWRSATTARAAWYLGRDGHGYAFRVRARDGKGNRSAWNVSSVTYAAAPKLAKGGFGRVAATSVNARAAPSTSATVATTFAKGTILALTGGPVSAGGYTWFEVRGPVAFWQPIDFVESSLWVAVADADTTLVAAIRPPNSTRVQATLRQVTFDGAAASVGTSAAALAARSFSPNGDSWEDELVVRWNSRVDFDTLQLAVLGSNGAELGRIDLAGARGAGSHAYRWNGRVAGRDLPDGTYVLRLVGTAGGATFSWPSATPATSGQLERVFVRLDRVAPTLRSASLSSRRLAPDGDGRFDRASVSGSASSDATRWELTATRAGAATPVRRITGSGPTAATSWNGKADGGADAPDGTYSLTLRFFDAAGNPAARTWTITLDRTPAPVALSASPASFSPNGDRAADTTRLAWRAGERLSGWVRVVRGSTVVRRWAIAGTSGAITWNGRDAAGRAVADGRYAFQLEGTDWFGHAVARGTWVHVDRTVGSLHATPALFFPQDGDSLASAATITFRLTRRAGVTLRILDAAGGLVRRPWTDREFAAGMHTWSWDGTLPGGTWAPRGRYTVVVTVVGAFGASELRSTVAADAFTTQVSSATPRAGATFAVIFRSAEPLRSTPGATIQVAGGTAIPLAVVRRSDGSWRGTVKLPPAWRGPATVTLTGRDTGGRANTSTRPVTIR